MEGERHGYGHNTADDQKHLLKLERRTKICIILWRNGCHFLKMAAISFVSPKMSFVPADLDYSGVE